ncbi:hemerythrin domain-containing protein [bacterium]|nr:hemerythrin domain-containing protein [bacterium]
MALSLKELIQNILMEHHVLLRRELPRLELLLGEIAAEYGAENQKLCEAFETFKKVKCKIEIHLGDEEQFLFPACLKLESSEAADPAIVEVTAGPNLLDRLVEMESEHENSGKAFETILAVVNAVAVTEDSADGICHQFADGLTAVIADLKVHVQKENEQVHPRARQLLSAL